jgi:hypothetical protein
LRRKRCDLTLVQRGNAITNSKDVVIAGVSTGIGWETTKVLVSKGFRVFGSVGDQTDADRLQSELGIGFVPLMMDIVDPTRYIELLKTLQRRL